MKKTLLMAASILALTSVSALAEGPYVAANAGLSIFHDVTAKDASGTSHDAVYKLGFGGDVAVGYSFNQNLRAEAEIGYRTADVDKMDSVALPAGVTASMNALSYMVNGYYDITQANLPVVPFVGLGAGMISGSFKYTDPTGSDTTKDTVFGYQAMLGVSYAINKNVSVNCNYKFQGAASDFEKDGTKIPYTSSTINLGARYNF